MPVRYPARDSWSHPAAGVRESGSGLQSDGRRRSTKNEVASLRIDEIAGLSREELLDVIEGAQLPLITADALNRLTTADRGTLEVLARAARRCCRNQGY